MVLAAINWRAGEHRCKARADADLASATTYSYSHYVRSHSDIVFQLSSREEHVLSIQSPDVISLSKDGAEECQTKPETPSRRSLRPDSP